MKITTKLFIGLIVSAILLITFTTIAALVSALEIAYTILAIMDAVVLFIILIFWLDELV